MNGRAPLRGIAGFANIAPAGSYLATAEPQLVVSVKADLRPFVSNGLPSDRSRLFGKHLRTVAVV